jgi:AcrR family transcriptional regulator
MTDPLSPRRANTRNAILQAAQAEFIAEGYGGATLAGVARRASVSTATLHKYFATKRELFGGVMERFWENEGAETPQPLPTGDPDTALRTVGHAYAALLLAADTAPLFRVIVAESIRHPELGQELYQRGKKPYLDRLEAYVRAAVAAGMLRVDDVPLAVRQFLGMINDVVFWPRLLVADLVVTAADASRVVDEAVLTFLARYGPARSGPARSGPARPGNGAEAAGP